MLRSRSEWIVQYQQKRALWLHNGKPKYPHALLTSGNHSSGFFNSELVMEDPILLDEAAGDLIQLLREAGLDLCGVDRVVGPAMGAITIAHEIARHIGMARGRACLRAYTEKEVNSEEKKMIFKKTSIRPGEVILPVEDVLTTGGSVELTESAVMKSESICLPYVAVLVNRSGLQEVNGNRIVSLVNCSMPIWTPEECPLCKQGSLAIRPKGKENWALLNKP